MTKIFAGALAALLLTGNALAEEKPAAKPADTKAKPAAAPAAKPADPEAAKNEAVALLRKDLRAEKADILAKTMNLDAAQAAAFWPLYKAYEAELKTVNDERIAIVKDIAANLATLTDAKALELADRSLAVEEKKVALAKKYKAEMAKALPGKVVTRFLQVDSRLNKLIDLSLAAEVPIVY